MADWNLPDSDTPYPDVPGLLRDLSLDAAQMFLTEPTNPVDGMIMLSRSPVKFQARGSGSWSDLALSVSGGGTGAATPADARSNLGLGSLALQDSSSVSISGGTLAGDGSGLTSLNASNLASGTVPDARFPSTLPALNASNLTAVNASAITSGTLPDARFPATLPALSGENLTTLNASNLASGTVPQARKWSSTTITTTGTINNLSFGDADQILMNNTSAATITGLAAGVLGQRVTIISIGAGQVDLAHQNTGSSTANRLMNFATSGKTSLAPEVGTATYEYQLDGSDYRWRLVAHQQGAFISQPYSAGDYTANGSMTWTVDSGDVSTFEYMLIGRQITIFLVLSNTTVGGTANTQLNVALPGGFSNASACRGPCVAFPAGGITLARFVTSVGGSVVAFNLGGANWTLGTNNTTIEATIVAQVA